MTQVYPDRRILTELHKDERFTTLGFIIVGLFALVIIAGMYYLYTNFSKKEKTVVITKTIYVSASPAPTNAFISPTQPIATQNNQSGVKEYFIPFGTGTNQTSDWTDVPGDEVSIDFGSYQNIKAIYFEVAVNIPSAESVSVRLFNKTDQHPVWYSDITTTTSGYIVSQPIVYDGGNKIYQVQMKTQLQALAYLTQARIHIILN